MNTPYSRTAMSLPRKSSSRAVFCKKRLLKWYVQIRQRVRRLRAWSVTPDHPVCADLLARDHVAILHPHVAALSQVGRAPGDGTRLVVFLEGVVLSVLLVGVRGDELARASGDVHEGERTSAVDHEKRYVDLGKLVPAQRAYKVVREWVSACEAVR